MTIIGISGWNIGFDKVRFTRLLQAKLGLSLTRAKGFTDAVMEGSRIELEVPEVAVNELVTNMTELGARVEVAVSAHPR